MVPDPVILVVPDHTSELVVVMNPLERYFPSIVLFMVLISPNQSEKPFSMFSICLVFIGRVVQAHLRPKVIDFPIFIFVFLFLSVFFITCYRSHCKLEEVSKGVLIFSENEEDVASLSVTPCIMVLSVSRPAAAGFSVEMLGKSRVLAKGAKSWPCSKGVDSLVNRLLPSASVPRHARFSSRAGFKCISTCNIAFSSSEAF